MDLMRARTRAELWEFHYLLLYNQDKIRTHQRILKTSLLQFLGKTRAFFRSYARNVSAFLSDLSRGCQQKKAKSKDFVESHR